MGGINDVFISNESPFKKLERVLNFILSHEKNKSDNLNVLKEIGLANQYSFVLDLESSKNVLYFAKNNKSIKHYVSAQKMTSNFVKWTKLLFNINEEDLNSAPNYNQKIHDLKKIEMNKWFFQKNIKKNLIQKKPDIKLIQYGIPKYLRTLIWETIIAEKYSNGNYYKPKLDQNDYNLFLNKAKNDYNIQIDKDLTRTFPEKKDQTPQNLEMLKNLLIYASSLIKDGYCQGLNFIVGFILKVTNFDEIKSYYFLKNILPLIKGYFEQGFPLLKKNISSFYKLFNKLFPKLLKHFNEQDVYSQFWVGKWFQTLFILSFPFEESCYIWDILLIKGFDFCIYLSLAIIYYLENELLKLEDSSDIISFLKNYLNPEKTFSISYNKFNDNNKKKYIIPINKIFKKAVEFGKKCEQNKLFTVSDIKTEDIDSISTKLTRNSDSVLSHNILSSSNISKTSSKSIISDSSLHISNIFNKQDNINSINITTNIRSNSKKNLTFEKMHNDENEKLFNNFINNKTSKTTDDLNKDLLKKNVKKTDVNKEPNLTYCYDANDSAHKQKNIYFDGCLMDVKAPCNYLDFYSTWNI